MHPAADKLVSVPDGYLLRNVTGIRAHIVSRLDGKGYDVTKREYTNVGWPIHSDLDC